MARNIPLVVAVLLAASSAFAQTVERTIDLSQLGWGSVDAIPVEVDGNIATEEWAVKGIDWGNGNIGLWRVVAVTPFGMCAGAWFDPRPVKYADVTIQRIAGRDRLVASVVTWTPRGFGRTLTIVALDPPTCDSGGARH